LKICIFRGKIGIFVNGLKKYRVFFGDSKKVRTFAMSDGDKELSPQWLKKWKK